VRSPESFGMTAKSTEHLTTSERCFGALFREHRNDSEESTAPHLVARNDPFKILVDPGPWYGVYTTLRK
jgi:hypothetical protein